MTGPTRWGIVSAGHISHDFAAALGLTSKDKHVVSAVAARNLDRARSFASELNIPKAYGSYEELAADPHIDVVYVGTIPSAHCQVIKMMIMSRKPVVSEKPAFVNHKQAAEVIALAKEKRVFFMEGMWSMFFPAFTKLRQVVEEKTLGDVRIINYTMGFNYAGEFVHEVDWRMDPKEGGGITLGFGVYAVALSQWMFREMPLKVEASGNIGPSGCDLTSTFILHFSDNKRLVCTVSSECQMANIATISCEKGCIRMPFPWCPIELQVKDEVYTFPLPETDIKFTFFHCPGFSYEADHVRDLLHEGACESPIVSHADTLSRMKIIDDLRRQMGVIYPEDD